MSCLRKHIPFYGQVQGGQPKAARSKNAYQCCLPKAVTAALSQGALFFVRQMFVGLLSRDHVVLHKPHFIISCFHPVNLGAKLKNLPPSFGKI